MTSATVSFHSHFIEFLVRQKISMQIIHYLQIIVIIIILYPESSKNL